MYFCNLLPFIINLWITARYLLLSRFKADLGFKPNFLRKTAQSVCERQGENIDLSFCWLSLVREAFKGTLIMRRI